MPVSIAETTRSQNANRRSAQVPELALDLGLDLERLLALPHAPLVARDHELAHLLPQPLVGGRRGGLGELRDLRVHVERGLAARYAPRRLRLHELADLLVGLGLRGGAAR